MKILSADWSDNDSRCTYALLCDRICILSVRCLWGISAKKETVCRDSVVLSDNGMCRLYFNRGFPAMIKHIFFGYRGTEAIDNFKKSDNYWDNLKAFFQIVNSQLFGNILAYILIALLVLACVGMLQKYTDVLAESKMTKLSLPLDHKVKIRYILIFVPCVCYFMIVSKITFVNADRYMWPIYAIAFTAVMCLTCTIWRQVLKDGAFIVVTAMMIAVIAWGSFSSCGWQYLFRESQNLLGGGICTQSV